MFSVWKTLYMYIVLLHREDVELICLFLNTLMWTLRTYEYTWGAQRRRNHPSLCSFFSPVWIYCILNLHNPVRSPIYFNSVCGSSRHRSPCKPSLTFKVYFKANCVSGRQTLFLHIPPQTPWRRRKKNCNCKCVCVSVGRHRSNSWKLGWVKLWC